jgi:hypothetical protein
MRTLVVVLALLHPAGARGASSVAEIMARDAAAAAGSGEPGALPPVTLAIPITDDAGLDVGVLELHEGDQPADAAHAFCVDRGLPPHFRCELIASLCASVPCARGRALLYVRILIHILQRNNIDMEHGSACAASSAPRGQKKRKEPLSRARAPRVALTIPCPSLFTWRPPLCAVGDASSLRDSRHLTLRGTTRTVRAQPPASSSDPTTSLEVNPIGAPDELGGGVLGHLEVTNMPRKCSMQLKWNANECKRGCNCDANKMQYK